MFNGTETAGVVSFDTDFIGNVRIEARKASATPFYQPWVTQVVTAAGETATATALQVSDE
ncbi:MAG: hypothetical protein U5N55_10700 [Cypionkella sp.]|nr:hypothetical protein [Cypionkella sp.]